MLYVKINEDLYPIEKFQSFKTQAGNDAIRIVGDVPVADDGFMIVNEKNELISDKHLYKHLYRQDDNCKEYTAVEEQIIPTEAFTNGTPDDPYSILSRRISAISNEVNDITPYTDMALVGIQDTEFVFHGVFKEGVLTATLKTDRGEYLPCKVERRDDVVRVTFEELTEVAIVTITVQ